MSDEFSRKIDYQFKNTKLLTIALTHRSCSIRVNNERLEFLGDAVVNLIIAEALIQKFPNASEGELSRFRATLVSRNTLGHLARDMEVGRYLHLGPGEIKSGGSSRLSILSCTLEAIIGAIFCDGGYDPARECVLKWYQPLLHSLDDSLSQKDPKTLLQEYLQSQQLGLPIYTVKSISGEPHQQYFEMSCEIHQPYYYTVGKASSRRKAEQEAARLMLLKIQKP